MKNWTSWLKARGSAKDFLEACKTGDLQRVESLLMKGADPNFSDSVRFLEGDKLKVHLHHGQHQNNRVKLFTFHNNELFRHFETIEVMWIYLVHHPSHPLYIPLPSSFILVQLFLLSALHTPEASTFRLHHQLLLHY